MLAAIDHASWRQRPRLGKRDVPLLLWRAFGPGQARMAEPT